MPDSALYFPYVEPIPSRALTRVLLYWDVLGAITPRGWSHRERIVQELVSSELVRPLSPRLYLDSQYDAIARDFEPLLDASLPHFRPRAPIVLDLDKIDFPSEDVLVARGLAERPGPNRVERGIMVEGNAGALYLALLAHRLAELPELEMEPVTDHRLSFEATIGFGSFSISAATDSFRSSALTGVLPAPARWIPVSQLVAFKERHDDELRALRREVERNALACAKEPEPEIRRRVASEFRLEIEQRANEVRARMAERKWPTTDGLLVAALKAATGVAAGIAAGSAELAVTAGAAPPLIDVLTQRRRPGARDLSATYAVLAQDAFDTH